MSSRVMGVSRDGGQHEMYHADDLELFINQYELEEIEQ
jgi:hypothetical protein